MSEIVKHPRRYPKHPSDKGQVLGGECNRTACKRTGARWFNAQTFGYYCTDDAMGIDRGNRVPICSVVDHQLTLAEMEHIHRETVEQVVSR